MSNLTWYLAVDGAAEDEWRPVFSAMYERECPLWCNYA